MMPTSFDELNRLVGMKRSEPFDEYFAPMKISEEQKKERIRLAEKLEEEFIYMLALMFYSYPDINTDMALELKDRYMQALIELGVASGVVGDMANAEYELQAAKFATTAVETTQRHKDDPYYYSEDRARLCAENESNTIWAYTEYAEAVKDKSYKQWHTIMDGKERDSHAEVNGTVLPINEPFVLQGGMMQYPMDDSMGVSDEEIVNCRCSLSFM